MGSSAGRGPGSYNWMIFPILCILSSDFRATLSNAEKKLRGSSIDSCRISPYGFSFEHQLRSSKHDRIHTLTNVKVVNIQLIISVWYWRNNSKAFLKWYEIYYEKIWKSMKKIIANYEIVWNSMKWLHDITTCLCDPRNMSSVRTCRFVTPAKFSDSQHTQWQLLVSHQHEELEHLSRLCLVSRCSISFPFGLCKSFDVGWLEVEQANEELRLSSRL